MFTYNFFDVLKILLMKRELAKNPELANENWERFLPKFKKYGSEILCSQLVIVFFSGFRV